MKFEDLPQVNGFPVAGLYLRPPENNEEPYRKCYRHGVVLLPMQQEDGSYLWKISEPKGGMGIGTCVNNEGDWELESSASREDKNFFKRCRYETIAQALQAWRIFEEKEQKRNALITAKLAAQAKT